MDMATANVTISICSHLTVAAVCEQHCDTATRSVNDSHLLGGVLRYAARVHKLRFMMRQSNVCDVLRHDDVCKGGNHAHSWG